MSGKVTVTERYIEISQSGVCEMTANHTEPRGNINIDVSNDLALDSYNHEVECSIQLDLTEAEQLRDWLSNAIRTLKVGR